MSKLANRLIRSAAFKRIQLKLMAELLSRATGEKAPALRGCHEQRLADFARFSARCAQHALEQADGGRALGRAVRAQAFGLGQQLGSLPIFRSADPLDILQGLYANINIELIGKASGEMRMTRCMFADYYQASECAFMAHFDEGVMAGLLGDGSLSFHQRISEGALCCCALFEKKGACS